MNWIETLQIKWESEWKKKSDLMRTISNYRVDLYNRKTGYKETHFFDYYPILTDENMGDFFFWVYDLSREGNEAKDYMIRSGQCLRQPRFD